MNVILLENVENLGRIGDLVKVKPGYGRNYLLPQGKAALATPENMKEIEARRAELEKAAAEELAAAKARADALAEGILGVLCRPQQAAAYRRRGLEQVAWYLA